MASKFFRGIVPVVMAIILVAAVAHVASSESTGGFGGHMGHHGMHGGMFLLRTANLTDAQKKQVHAIFEARRTSRKAEYEQLKAAREAIAAKFTSTGPLAASDLSASTSQIAQLRTQMMNERIQDAIAIRNLLTPAQLAKISATKAKLDNIHAEMKALFAHSGGDSTPTE